MFSAHAVLSSPETFLTRPLTAGKSGAIVALADDSTDSPGGIVLKYVRRDTGSAELWSSSVREAQFYTAVMQNPAEYPYAPEILDTEITDMALCTVMRRYRPLTTDTTALSPALFDRICGALAAVHASPIPESFLPLSDRAEPPYLTDAVCAECAAGWETVLAEHLGAFSREDRALPAVLAADINGVIARHFVPPAHFVHGDFHIGNLLWDTHGDIRICDWQSCGIGDSAGDLAFFISRLSADGFAPDTDDLIHRYCSAVGQCSAVMSPAPEEIRNRMRLSSALTAFRFWHQYLHGAPAERVEGIFRAMAEDFAHLL